MVNFFARQAIAYKNELNQSCSELTGLAEGLIADKQLNDAEIQFLHRWLERHDVVACQWPGDVLHARVKAVISDGVITEEERGHLLDTLRLLVGGHLDRLAEAPRVNELALDGLTNFAIADSLFCLTGDFVYAPRAQCEEAVISRGGKVSQSVTKKLNYLVVGGLGSKEWKHGSFGTKIEKAMEYKRAGCPIFIVHENAWMACL